MRIYNTLTRKVEEFIPINKEQITLIINSINEVMKRFRHVHRYEISRNIYHALELEISEVETNYHFGRIFIKLKK